MFPFRPTCVLRNPRTYNGAQVLGTDVPSYRHYPYRANDVLHLYKKFLHLIYYHHTKEERVDLLFRLRNEFASKKHLSGPKQITAALRRGEGMYALQQQILDTKEMRQRNRASNHFSSKEKSATNKADHSHNTNSVGSGGGGGAVSVDSLWEQFRTLSGNVLPGLQEYDVSRSISAGSYVRQGSTSNVYSRRR